jgi:hypothetical protein
MTTMMGTGIMAGGWMAETLEDDSGTPDRLTHLELAVRQGLSRVGVIGDAGEVCLSASEK